MNVNVNGKEYKEDETNLVNGKEYEFEIILNSNEKTIYSVNYLNAKSNNKIEASNSNGKYLITISGDTQIFVTTAYIYNELTNSSVLDFDNYQYEIIILGPEGTNDYYMFDGALEKSKLTASGNVLKNDDNAVIFNINDNKVILKEELLNSTFIIDKALNDKYILKTKNGLYIGTNSLKSGSLSASDKDVYYSLLSFENNKIKINFGENILEYNTGSDVFKYYTGTQKQVEVFYRINKEYTLEEKTERMNFLTDLELNYVKSLFEKSYIVLENPLNIEIDSKKVALSIEDDGNTLATVLNNVLTIPVQEHTVDKIIKIKLATDAKEEIISISIPKVESKTAKEAYDLINSFEANNQYSDSLYFVSGIVKTITEKNNKYTIEIYSESNDDEIITVYNALSTIDKIYVGDTIKAVGYLQKYIKDNNVVPEIVAHNNVNVQVLSRTAGNAVVAFNIPSEFDDKVHIYVDSSEVFMPVIGKNGDELKFRIEVTDLKVKTVKNGDAVLQKENDFYTVIFNNSQIITIELSDALTYSAYAKVTSKDELEDGMYITFIYESKAIAFTGVGSNTLTTDIGFVTENTYFGTVDTLLLTKVKDKENTWLLSYDFGADGVKYFAPNETASYGTAKWTEEPFEWTLNDNLQFIATVGTKNFIIRATDTKISTYNSTGSQKNVSIYKNVNEVTKSSLEAYLDSLLNDLKNDLNNKEYNETTEIEIKNNGVISDISITLNNASVDNTTDPYVTFADGKLKILKTNTSTEYDMIVKFNISVKVYYENNSKYFEKTAENITVTLSKATSSSTTVEYKNLAYTLDGTQPDGDSTYATASNITQNEINWKVTGNTNINPWRIGGKSLTNEDRDVYSTVVVSKDNLGKVVVSVGTASSITVNSITLIVSKNSDFSNPVSTISNKSFAANSDIEFVKNDGDDWSDCYFKIVFNVSVSSTSNKFVQLNKIEFYK